jgi:hypothetical protein
VNVGDATRRCAQKSPGHLAAAEIARAKNENRRQVTVEEGHVFGNGFSHGDKWRLQAFIGCLITVSVRAPARRF